MFAVKISVEKQGMAQNKTGIQPSVPTLTQGSGPSRLLGRRARSKQNATYRNKEKCANISYLKVQAAWSKPLTPPPAHSYHVFERKMLLIKQDPNELKKAFT